MKTIRLIALSAAASAWCATASGGAPIAHFPLDADFLSIVNTGSNPAGEETVSSSGTWSLVDDVPSTNIAIGASNRLNAKAMRFERAVIGIDLSGFTDLTTDLKSATIEWFFKGDKTELTAWRNPLRLSSGTSASTAYIASAHLLLMQLNTDKDPYLRLDTYDGTSNNYCAQKDGCDGEWHHLALTIEPVLDGEGVQTGSKINFFFDHAQFGSRTLASPWYGAAQSGEKLYFTIGHPDIAAFEIDELRISEGVLTPHEMLWATDPQPTKPAFADIPDGRLFVNFPFDGSLAAGNFDYRIPCYTTLGAGGSITYTTDVAGSHVASGSDIATNTHAVVLDKAQVWFSLSDLPWSEAFTNATIEFHTKAAVDDLTAYAVLAHLSSSTNRLDAGNDLLSLMKYQAGNATTHGKGNYCIIQGHTAAGEKSNYTMIKNNGNDGEWHHVAYTIEQIVESGVTKSRLYAYYDYEPFISEAKITVPWVGVPDNDQLKMYLTLGSTNSKVAFDELRISKGVLPVYRQTRVTDFIPRNKDVLLHLSFEGDISSRVDTDDRSPYILSGSTSSYSGDKWKDAFYDPRTGAIESNGQSIASVAATTSIQIGLPAWCLSEEVLDSATIEFFLKGDLADASEAWSNPIWLVSPGRNALLLQRNSAGNISFQAVCTYPVGDVSPGGSDTAYWSSSIPIADGKWHHIAVTIDPTADGHSKITYFHDYEPVHMVTTTSYAWRGLADGSYLRTCHGKTSGSYLFDEFRISKGVLDKSEFLRARHTGGLILLVR